MYAFNYKDELYHYGVLGMKWGVRRYQPYGEGGYTPKKAPKKTPNKTPQYYQQNSYQYWKNKYGLSNKEAKKYSDKYNKIMKGVVIGAGVALAAGATYALYQKYGSDFIDKTIRAGATIQNIGSKDIIEKGERFYGAFNRNDKNKYVAYLGKEYRPLKTRGQFNYKNEIKVASKIKVASNKSGEKAYNELLKDPIFKNSVKKVYGGDVSYKDFNTHALIYTTDPDKRSIQQKFFKALSDKGYSAVNDINDQKGGFSSVSPTIFFDKSKLQDKYHWEQIKQSDIDKATIKVGADEVKRFVLENPYSYVIAGGTSFVVGDTITTAALSSKARKESSSNNKTS